jgi:hypothetical protein
MAKAILYRYHGGKSHPRRPTATGPRDWGRPRRLPNRVDSTTACSQGRAGGGSSGFIKG